MNAVGLLMIRPFSAPRGAPRTAKSAQAAVKSGHVFLVFRSKTGPAPGLWAIPGGEIEPGERALDAVQRECIEELGGLPKCKLVDEDVFRSGDLKYITLIAEVSEKASHAWHPHLNHEHDDWGWFRIDYLPSPIHFNVQRVLGNLSS